MALHFSEQEFRQRINRTCEAMLSRELDGLLVFAPESQYYLTGYDTFGFALFQCMIVRPDGSVHLFTRLPDLRQAQQTSILSDDQIHVWHEHENSDPYLQLCDLLAKLNLNQCRLGIELKTVGLTAYNGQQLSKAVAGKVSLVDASDLVGSLRRQKSPKEIEYHRKAAELSDLAFDAALETTHAGAFEGDILAAMQGAVFKGGGGYAGNEFIIGSGPAALLCRYQSALRRIDDQDQMTLEWSGAYHRYHAAMMRTLIVGQGKPIQKQMHRVALAALQACEEAIVPGRPMGDVFDAHARVFDDSGFSHARMQACGYGMGAVFNPIWVDFPMFYQGNPQVMNVGNVFFLHMILMDSTSGLAMCWGHSVLVTDCGVERLSRSTLELVEIACY